jgi:outer membrane protein assembly factor BamB
VGGGALKNWSYRTGAVTLSPPALDPGNMVMAGSNDSRLHAMSSSTGARLYQPGGLIGTTGGAVQSRPALIPAIVTSVDCDPVTAGQQPCDVAYAGSADGRVYAFAAATGTQLWQSPVLGSAIVGTPVVQLATFSASYPHAFDLVMVGTRNTADTTNNAIYGLDGNTGAIVWTFAPGNLDIISSGGVLDYLTNSVWFTSRAGALGTQPSFWKLSTATTDPAGSLISSVMLNSLPAANRDIDAAADFDPQIAYLFAVTTGGDLVAVDHVNPNNVFSTNVGAFSGMGFPTVLASPGDNDDIYFGTSGGVHKRTFNRLTQTFSPGWDTTVATLGGTPSTPVFAYAPLPPFLYVGVSDGRLKKLDLTTGTILLTRDINLGATVGDPSLDVVSSKLYVGDTSGRIYSFDIF